MNKPKNTKGITLIALVITIIVLILLAGISINLVLGENGIITRAKETAKLTKEASIIEEIQQKIMEKQIEQIDMSKKSNMIVLLSEYGTVKEENGKIVSLITKEGEEIAIERIYGQEIKEDNATYIRTKAELEAFRDKVNEGNTYENETIVLMQDIDLEGTEEQEESYWNPIGESPDVTFKGTFDGNHKKISNLYIKENNTSNVRVQEGFFGDITDASIRNLTVSGEINIEGNTIAAGGIVDACRGKITIENCKSEVNITSTCTDRAVGGIIAVNANQGSVIIKNCMNTGAIAGKNDTGGILGYSNGTVTIENCSNEGKINSAVSTAGCIGRVRESSNININTFTNKANISSESASAAGCIGTIEKGNTIANLTNVANICEKVEGYTITGGILGYSGENNTLIISNSYNTSEIISNIREAGGIIGDTDSSNYLINVYNTGNCTAHISSSPERYTDPGSSGGLIGSSFYNESKISIINAYNIGNMEAVNKASGIVGIINHNFTDSHIKNVYSIGELNGSIKSGILGFAKDSYTIENSQIENAYYLNTVEQASNVSMSSASGKTREEINSEEFVKTLNTYVENNPEYRVDNNTTIKLLKWKLGNNGYPIME